MSEEYRTYVIRPKDEDEFEVLEVRKVGETLLYDNEGYGYPNYLYTSKPIGVAETYKEAQAYINGLLRNTRYDDRIHSFKHPTFTMSVGAPGDFALAGDAPYYESKGEKK